MAKKKRQFRQTENNSTQNTTYTIKTELHERNKKNLG